MAKQNKHDNFRFILYAVMVLLMVAYVFMSNVGDAPAMVGKQAPDFTLASVTGEQITLSALAGKPVLLNFWQPG